MVVNRRHSENAFAGGLERDHLHYDGYRLHHEKAADNRQNNFMFDGNRGCAKYAAERE